MQKSWIKSSKTVSGADEGRKRVCGCARMNEWKKNEQKASEKHRLPG